MLSSYLQFQTRRSLLVMAIVATMYFAAGWMGLRLSYLGGNVTLVWPPSGIAVAAMLLFGHRMVIAVAIGAIITTASTGAPFGFVLATGIGNSLAAYVSRYVLHQKNGKPFQFETVKDILRFALGGMLLGPLLSALVGVTGLCLTEMIPAQSALPAAACWWLGDAMGVLVVAPLLITWAPVKRSPFAARVFSTWQLRAEYLGLLVCMLLLGYAAYGLNKNASLSEPLSYAFFPLITWAALRFEHRGVTLAIFLCMAFAVWGTAHGTGPFAQESLHLSLGYLHAYMAVVSMTGLLLAAVMGERRRAEQMAAETADRLQLAVRAANIGLWDWDLTSNKVAFSPEWKGQLGYEPDEIGDHLDEWKTRCHPDDVEPTLRQVRRHLNDEGQGGYAFQFRMRHKDGSWRWIDSRAQKLVDSSGKASRLIGCHLDITERKQFEAAITQSEARFRCYFELGMIGMAITSPEKGWIDFNDRLCEILGYSREQLSRKSWSELTHPDDLQKNVEHFNQVLAGQVDGYSMEKRYIRGDGTIIHTDLAAKVVRRPDGSIDHFVSFVLDISESRRLEEQLRQSQKMEAIGQLAGGAAHDFNNYLTVIMGYCELLMARLTEAGDVRSSVETMYAASERASLLTRQLLAFSRQSVLQPRVISLNSIVHANEQLLRGLTGDVVRLRFVCDPQLKPIYADAGQLTQVLVNLVANARDAMPDGGELTIRTSMTTYRPMVRQDHARQDLDVSPDVGQVQMSVSDTGLGMSETVAARIFEPFFTTKALGKGTGLGLATVYGIVQQSGGQISVHSEVGQGTTFTMTFPGVTGIAEEPIARHTPLVSHQGSETILLVEDEQAVRDIAARALRAHGFQVLVAENAMHAMNIAAELTRKIDLLVSDVMMPGMNGFQLAEQLTRLRPSMRVLFASGYSQDSGVRDQIVESRMPWLQKPFAPSNLIEHVRRVLDEPPVTISSPIVSRAA